MKRAIILALALTAAVVGCCVSYTVGMLEGVTHHHTRVDIEAKVPTEAVAQGLL